MCAQVPAHMRGSAGGHGACVGHLCRSSWRRLTVDACPNAPLGATGRALARFPSSPRASKTLATHAATRGRVERRVRTHIGAFGTCVFVSPRRQTQRESTSKRVSRYLGQFFEFFNCIRLATSCACRKSYQTSKSDRAFTLCSVSSEDYCQTYGSQRPPEAEKTFEN